VFDGAGAHTFTVPEEMVGIEQVMVLQPNGEWTDLTRAENNGHAGWFPVFAGRGVAINGHAGFLANGRNVRVHGYMLPTELTNDVQETSIDREWLINTATAHLCLDTLLSRQNSAEWGQKGLFYQQRADQLLTRLTPNIGPSFARF
jgi:hypothetical protein